MASINTFQNSQTAGEWVTDTGLDLLLSTLQAAPFFRDDFEDAFKQEFAVGAQITVPLPQQYIGQRNNMAYNPQALDRPTTTLTVNQTDTFAFEWESVEQALQMERGDERARDLYVKPAISYCRSDMDLDLCQFAAQNANMITGVLGTNATSFDATSAAAKQFLSQMNCPVGDVDLGLLLPPAVIRQVKGTSISQFNPQTDISKQNRSGTIGKSDSFEWYESNNLYKHTAGTWAGAVTVTNANQSGSSLIVTCTTNDTFKQGDKFSIANVNQVNPVTRLTTSTSAAGSMTFSVTADATGAANSATLSIYPPIIGPGSQYQNVDALPAIGAALTLWPGTASPNGKSGRLGLALYRDGFLFAGVPLIAPKPSSVEVSSVTADPDTGLSLRFVRQWDSTQSRFTNRLDTLWGRGIGLAYQCAVVLPQA